MGQGRTGRQTHGEVAGDTPEQSVGRPSGAALRDAGAAATARLVAELEPSGIVGEPSLDDPALVDRYRARASRTELGFFKGSWSSATRESRAKAVLDAVNTELATIGAPPLSLVLDEGMGSAQSGGAAFLSAAWSVKVSPEMFAAAEPDPAVLQIMYHEARHAEQSFRMARLLAGRGAADPEIAQRLQLPGAVVARARVRALRGDEPEAREAAEWLEDLEDHAHHEHEAAAASSLGGIDMSLILIRVQRIVDKSIDKDERRRSFIELQASLRKFLPYVSLPIERDAYRVGLKVMGVDADVAALLKDLVQMTFEDFDR